MDVYVKDDIELQLTLQEAAAALDVAPDSPFYDEFAEVCRAGLAVARPKAMYGLQDVQVLDENRTRVGAMEFDSALMAYNFKETAVCCAAIFTCGTEIADWSETLEDALHIWWADKLKELVLREAHRVGNALVKELLGAEKVGTMNPGSLADWPLVNQTGLFSLLGDVAGRIGVTLTDSMLMLPTKSTSGLYFEITDSYENCMFCEMANCPNRRMPFDKTMKEAILG